MSGRITMLTPLGSAGIAWNAENFVPSAEVSSSVPSWATSPGFSSAGGRLSVLWHMVGAPFEDPSFALLEPAWRRPAGAARSRFDPRTGVTGTGRTTLGGASVLHTGAMSEQNELGRFLKSRRARIDPGQS